MYLSVWLSKDNKDIGYLPVTTCIVEGFYWCCMTLAEKKRMLQPKTDEQNPN